MGDTLAPLLSGVVALVAVIITSIRKREDTTIEELRRRVADLERRETEAIAERDAADARADGYQAASLAQRRQLYLCRATLADHGIDDPTDGLVIPVD